MLHSSAPFHAHLSFTVTAHVFRPGLFLPARPLFRHTSASQERLTRHPGGLLCLEAIGFRAEAEVLEAREARRRWAASFSRRSNSVTMTQPSPPWSGPG